MLPFIHIGPLTLGTFGLLVATGLLCAFFILRADLGRRRLAADAETIVGFTGLAGLVGAKLYHLLQTPEEFFAQPFRLLIGRMGFAWFGSLLGGFLALVLLARHYRLPILLLLDVASPAAALGYGIGRIGCFVSGDGDYGVPTSLPWGMSFPNGLVPTTERVHPAPVYELIAAVIIFYFLWRRGAESLEKPRPGEIFGWYLLLTGIARFLVEFIRINPRTILGLTNAQVASLVSIVVGLALLSIRRGRLEPSPKRSPQRRS